MKPFKTNRTGAAYALTIFWLLLTLTLVAAVYYFNWQKETLETQRVLFFASDEIGDTIDNFVSDIQDSVYSIPVITLNIDECTSAIKEGLAQAVYNNPFISAITIKNNVDKVICSTLADPGKTVLSAGRRTGLIGPVTIKDYAKPSYIIQQRLGEYFIDVYLLQSVLEHTLRTNSPYAHIVALYDQSLNKVILQIQRNNETGHWESSPQNSYLNLNKLNVISSLVYRGALNDLDNYQIILIADPSKVLELTFWHKLISLIIVILISLFLYFYLKRLMVRHFSLHRAIVHAVKTESFFPVYQPIYDLEAKKFLGIEVFVRWRTTSNEVIMPDVFVEDAEKSGLIVPITLQIIKKALLECRHILANNPSMYLGFNLSAAHFSEPEFFKRFNELCIDYHIKPEQLLLEITERELLSHNEAQITERMKQLRLSGYSLAIDDFGTGHASISYLRHFPFNYLKIDQLFVTAIGTGALTEALSHSIIQMAKNLKLNIIAEGVETQTQLDYLVEHGVHLIQGWYYAKAMPIYELTAFLKGVDNE